MSRNLLNQLVDPESTDETLTDIDSDTMSPIFKQSRSLCDLAAINNTGHDPVIISHSKSATNLSPTKNTKIGELENSMLALSSLLQILTNNVTTITNNMATKTELAALDKKVQVVDSNMTNTHTEFKAGLKKDDQILVANSDAMLLCRPSRHDF